MKAEILLVDPMIPIIEERLDGAYTVHRLFAAADRPAFVASVAPKVRAVVTGGVSGAGRALIDALPALEIIAINGIGTDAVDLERARERGIRVTATPDVLTDDVADLAMGLLIAAARRLCVGDRYVRAGSWPKREPFALAQRVSGKNLGIIGLGRIGRAIARRAEGFGLKIAYTDLRPFPELPYAYQADLLELAAASDFLIVAAAGGPQSRGIVNAAVLDALGPRGILINVARGSVVDETALVAALQEGRLGGAGLDVFVDEPNVPEALMAMEQVALQPHRASATVETRVAMGELVLANLAAHFAGQPPVTPVV